MTDNSNMLRTLLEGVRIAMRAPTVVRFFVARPEAPGSSNAAITRHQVAQLDGKGPSCAMSVDHARGAL